MKVLKVPDMHCENCAARIRKAFSEAGLTSEINLDGKTVSVEEDKLEQAAALLEELGFDAEA